MEPKETQNTPTDATPDVDAAAITAQAQKDERARVAAIEKIAVAGKKGGLEAKDVDDFLAVAKAGDMTPEKFGEEILGKLADKSDAETIQNTVVVGGEDSHDKRSRGIQAALLNRAPSAKNAIREAVKKNPDHPAFKDLDLSDGGEFRGLSLYELVKGDLEQMRPGASTGKAKMNVVGDFFAHAGNYQTTSDFAVGLENTLNKTLLAAYMIAPDTWRSCCGIGEVSDFRAHNRYRTGYVASLDQVFESGEFTSKTLPDAAKEAITALTYGNIVGLSRQAIINDDMGMFNRVAMQVGRAAALTIESGFYSLLALNSGLGPAMNDTSPLFDAAHSNLGAGAALSAAAVDADATIMEAQQDPNSQEYLAVRPSVLLVPRGLKGTAITINQSQFDPDTADSNKPNFVLGLFDQVVATPRLSGTRRYMFANPADMPCIEVAFLNGEQEPFMEMKDGWISDGVEWKVRHDFGIAAIEYRAGLTDAGA